MTENCKCAYGCGNTALFFNKRTGSGRCEEQVGNCPAIKAKKQASYEERAQLKRVALEAILANPQPCECNAPGLFYSERGKRWRCTENARSCPSAVKAWEDTLQERFGTTNLSKVPGVQASRKATLKANHTKRTKVEKDEIRDKREATMEERYGVKNAGQSKDLKTKRTATNVKKYGKEHTLQVDEFRQKGLDSYKAKTGFDHWAQNPETAAKKIETLISTYGVKYPFLNAELHAKQKATMMERYGVENAMHCSELAERAFANSTSTRQYVLPSGAYINVQGYESAAYDHLFAEGYAEVDFKYGKNRPHPQYYIDDVRHYYYPDIFVHSKNHVIEVKSMWTLYGGDEMNYVKNIAKMESVKLAGYLFTCLVFDDKGNLVETIGDPI